MRKMLFSENMQSKYTRYVLLALLYEEKMKKSGLLRRNLDAYYFCINTFFEFPEMKDHVVRQAMYDEFGFGRFSKQTFNASLIVGWAKNKAENLAQIYVSRESE